MAAVWDPRVRRFRDPKTGRFVKAAAHLASLGERERSPAAFPKQARRRNGDRASSTPVPAAHGDGLDELQDHQLRNLATEFEVPNAGRLSGAELLRGLRAAGARSPYLPGADESAETPVVIERYLSERGVRSAREMFQGETLTAAGREAINAFGPAGHPDVAAVPDTEGKIRAAYRILQIPGAGQDAYVSMENMRKLLGDQVPRAEVDDELRRLNRDQDSGVTITPQSYARENAATRIPAAVMIGGQENNLLHIDEQSPQAGTPGAGTTGSAASLATVEADIRSEAAKLAARSERAGERGWVDLVDLRRALGDRHSQADVDAALDRMVEDANVALQHEFVLSTLTPERHAAAVVIGGEPRHKLHLNRGLTTDEAARFDASDTDVEDGELIIDRVNLQRVEDARTIADLRAVARDRGLRIPSYLKRAREVRLWLHTELRLRPGEDVDSYLARTGGRPEAVASARPSSSSSGLERLMGGAYGTVPGERRAAPASGGAFTKQAARRASRSADIPPAARVREQLLQSTPDERRSLLAAYGMNKTQAREVARGLGIKNAGRMDVPNVIDRILSHFRAAGEPSGSRPISRPSPVDPVSGRISDRPLLPNTWGTFAQVGPGDINFHDHGPIGRAIHGMGDDRHLEVDGDALANVLGRIATDVVVGRVTAEQALGRYKQIRDRLPEGSTARYHLDVAIDNIDAPDSPVPATPPYTLAPLQRLLHDLHGVPLVRREPDTEEQPLLQILDDFAAGRLGGLRFIQAVRQLRNRRHESLGDSGKFEIDRAVDRAVEALEEMRRTDRQALLPQSR